MVHSLPPLQGSKELRPYTVIKPHNIPRIFTISLLVIVPLILPLIGLLIQLLLCVILALVDLSWQQDFPFHLMDAYLPEYFIPALYTSNIKRDYKRKKSKLPLRLTVSLTFEALKAYPGSNLT